SNDFEVIRTKIFSGYEMSSPFLEIYKNKYVFNNPSVYKAKSYYLIHCLSYTKPDAILFNNGSYIYTKQLIIPSYKKLLDIYKQILSLELDNKKFYIKQEESFIKESKKVYKLIKKLKWWAI
ncbi:MAG: hypothetical protein N2485_08650, partial [bacterium]|nr:hypothetical protein [bacterium]